jgi:DtxR family Mn-dependent transcriptional regulator
MSEPLLSLFIAISIIILVVILFRPNSKFLNHWRQLRHNRQRAMMEHALKHIYEYESNNIPCTLSSLAGAISENFEKTSKIMDILTSSDLLKLDKENFHLTKEGREYALRIIRLHRLWERYLAEETGLPEPAWHKEADIQEHNLTPEQAEKLNRRLGNPLFDPHGDPIPSSTGDIPIEQGIILTELDVGTNALITHIEDEPLTIYEKLVEKGFHLGMQVQIKDKYKNKYFLIVDGHEKNISQLEALNINVSPISEEQKIDYTTTTLDSLKNGQQSEIIAISRACHGQQRRRLMDFGILPGTEITVEMESLGGDPIAYFIRGTTIALRRNQAKMIHVKPVMEN